MARIESTRAEAAQKLGGWRQEAVLCVLECLPRAGRDENGSTAPPQGPHTERSDEERAARAETVARLQEAMRILHGHFHNEYRKLSMLRAQVLRAAIVVALALCAVLWVSVRASPVLGSTTSSP